MKVSREEPRRSPNCIYILSLSRQSRVTEVGEANVPERKPDRRTREERIWDGRKTKSARTSAGRRPEKLESKSERERIGNRVEKVRR